MESSLGLPRVYVSIRDFILLYCILYRSYFFRDLAITSVVNFEDFLWRLRCLRAGSREANHGKNWPERAKSLCVIDWTVELAEGELLAPASSFVSHRVEPALHHAESARRLGPRRRTRDWRSTRWVCLARDGFDVVLSRGLLVFAKASRQAVGLFARAFAMQGMGYRGP